MPDRLAERRLRLPQTPEPPEHGGLGEAQPGASEVVAGLEGAEVLQRPLKVAPVSGDEAVPKP